MRVTKYFLVWTSLLLCAASGSALADDPFQAGKDFGSSTKSSTAGEVNDAQARAVFPGYTDNSPESGYLSRAAAPFQQGDDKKARCATQTEFSNDSDHQDCDAVKYLSQMDGSNPFVLDKQNDPLMTTFKSAMQNKPDFNSLSSTQCTTKTVELSPAQYSTEVCNEYRSVERNTCYKILIVSPYETPGCAPGQFLTRVTADPCPGCIDYIAWDFTCGSGNYLMHFFTMYHGTTSVFMDLGSSYVPGTLNTQIPKTLGVWNMSGGMCFHTYYAQSCSGAYCTITAWFDNPCQGTGFNGAQQFLMPTTTGFTDTWEDQCITLDARTR